MIQRLDRILVIFVYHLIHQAYCYTLRQTNITLTEGEVYFHDFSSILFMNRNKTFQIQYSDAVTNNNSYYQSLEYRENKWNITLGKDALNNVTKEDFEHFSCSGQPTGTVLDLSIVYERKSNLLTSGQSKYLIQFKKVRTEENNQSFVDTHLKLENVTVIDMKDFRVQSSACKKEIVVQDFNKILFICQSLTHNQYFILSLCSDSTCNEQTDNLKIKDYVKEANFESVRVKKMPGIDETTFSFLVFFEGLEYLEYILINEVGKVESQVFKMDFPIKDIRYFSGQFLSFESIRGSSPVFYFIFFDFGVKKLDFTKVKPREVLNFGQFVNSYVSSVNGDILVELLNNDMLLDMSLKRESNEFMIEYSKRLFDPGETPFSPSSVFVFEMAGDYQLVIERKIDNSVRGTAFTRFKVLNRFEAVDSAGKYLFADKFAYWAKISGFNKLSGCTITKNQGNESDFEISILTINLVEPHLRITAPQQVNTELLKKKSLESTSGSAEQLPSSPTTTIHRSLATWAFHVNLTRTPGLGEDPFLYEKINYRVINITGFKIGFKECLLDNNTLRIESSGTSSDDSYPLKDILRGNLFAIMKACYDIDKTECQEFTNRINPLLSYKTLMTSTSTNDHLLEELNKNDIFIALSSVYNYQIVFEILGYNQKTQNLSIFDSYQKTVVRRKSEISKIGFSFAEVFNDTIFIIHSDQGLYMYETMVGEVKELIFDSGKCEKILLMRHTGLDLILWCFLNSTASAFYARDVVEGKAGIRKLPVKIDKELNFLNKTMKFNDYFPEFIFMIGSDNIIEVLKIETKSSIHIKRFGQINVSEPHLNTKLIDFEMVDRYLMIYQSQRIGFGDRIILSFYFLQNPFNMVKTKVLKLDYKFSPDYKDNQIYKFEDKKKYGMARIKYANKPMFLLKVKYLNLYSNVLFLDPKATLAETIPVTLLPLSSTVTEMKVGKSLSVNEFHIRTSIIVYYSFEEEYLKTEAKNVMTKLNRTRTSLMKIDEMDPSLRLTNSLDKNIYFSNGNSKETKQYVYLEFEIDYLTKSNPNPIAITITRTELKGRIERLVGSKNVKFSKEDDESVNIQKQLENQQVISVPGKLDSQIYWLQNPSNITEGDVSNWTSRMESTLEQFSGVVKLETLFRDRKPMNKNESEFVQRSIKRGLNCTSMRRDFLHLKIVGVGKKFIPVDFQMCLNMAEMQFTAMIYDSEVPEPLNFTQKNNLLTTDPQNLDLYSNDGILELINYRKLNGRIVFTDFYRMNINLTEKSRFSFSLDMIVRRFYTETTKDYLIRAVQEIPFSEVINNTNYEYIEWSIMKGVDKFYQLGLVREKWILGTNSNGSFNKTFTDKIENQLILRETLPDQKSKIEIYDEFSFKVIDKNDRKYLWLIVENPAYESYIMRFDIAKLGLQGENITHPTIWRLSNPFYGFESSYSIKSIKSNWLLGHFKIIGSMSYFLVYIIPPSYFAVDYNQSLHTLYIKESAIFENVINIEIEKTLEYIGRRGLTDRTGYDQNEQNYQKDAFSGAFEQINHLANDLGLAPVHLREPLLLQQLHEPLSGRVLQGN